MMISDMQLHLLTEAAQRADGLVVLPTTLRGGAVKAVVGKLLDLGLLEERAVAAGEPRWRSDEAVGPVGLGITRGGLLAAGVEPEDGDEQRTEGDLPRSLDVPAGPTAPTAPGPDRPVAGTKRALVVSLLAREIGASLDDLTAATGWLPHTTRAALTGLRQRGYALAKSRGGDGRTVYRIEVSPMEMPGQAAGGEA
jgi:hypothetical protein